MSQLNQKHQKRSTSSSGTSSSRLSPSEQAQWNAFINKPTPRVMQTEIDWANASQEKKNAYLIEAVRENHIEAVKIALSNGADAEIKGSSGGHLIYDMIKMKNPDLILLWVKKVMSAPSFIDDTPWDMGIIRTLSESSDLSLLQALEGRLFADSKKATFKLINYWDVWLNDNRFDVLDHIVRSKDFPGFDEELADDPDFKIRRQWQHFLNRLIIWKHSKSEVGRWPTPGRDRQENVLNLFKRLEGRLSKGQAQHFWKLSIDENLEDMLINALKKGLKPPDWSVRHQIAFLKSKEERQAIPIIAYLEMKKVNSNCVVMERLLEGLRHIEQAARLAKHTVLGPETLWYLDWESMAAFKKRGFKIHGQNKLGETIFHHICHDKKLEISDVPALREMFKHCKEELHIVNKVGVSAWDNMMNHKREHVRLAALEQSALWEREVLGDIKAPPATKKKSSSL